MKKYKWISYLLFSLVSIAMFLFAPSLWAKQAISFPIGVFWAKNESKLLENRTKLSANKKYLLTIIPCALVFVFCLFMRHFILRESEGYADSFFYLMQDLSLAFSVICFGRIIENVKAISTSLAFAATISYEVYLVHGYFENQIREKGITWLVIAVGLIIPISVLLHYFLIVVKKGYSLVKNKLNK